MLNKNIDQISLINETMTEKNGARTQGWVKNESH